MTCLILRTNLKTTYRGVLEVLVGYGKRWGVESLFNARKRTGGEDLDARKEPKQ